MIGAVFVANASREMLEASAVWGSAPPVNLIFPPSECWAYRRGQLHLAVAQERSCPHAGDDGRAHVCLPLLAQGEVLGILHLLDAPASGNAADTERTAERIRGGCSMCLVGLQCQLAQRAEALSGPIAALHEGE